MKKIMLLSNNQELITNIKKAGNIVFSYDKFMTVFEQLNFHNPDLIIFDFELVESEFQFMLESLPKKSEKSYIKLACIGRNPAKEQMADFSLKFENISSIKATKLN